MVIKQYQLVKIQIFSEEVSLSNSKFGIATKDSPIVDFTNVEMLNMSTCITAYKKKMSLMEVFDY